MKAIAGHQVEHLLLLVGGNPLPNAVSGKLLTMPKGTITLLHSAGTANVAGRLRSWLIAQTFTVELRQLEESNPASIVACVREALHCAPASVGLNYTGGTKAMSVHAYRAAEEWGQGNATRLVLSYLDARTLRMVIDPSNPESGQQGHDYYVGRDVQLSLMDLLQLHGWRLKNQPRTVAVMPNTAQQLKSIHAQQSTAEEWVRWIQDVLLQSAKRLEDVSVSCKRSPDGQKCMAQRQSRKWKSTGNLKQLELEWPTAQGLQPVVHNMKDELQQMDRLSIGVAAKKWDYEKPEDFCKWLEGTWLETVVLQALHACLDSGGLHEVSMGLYPASGGDHPSGFEFDVIGMRGYQLFAFSCTTDPERGRVKFKLFEAFVRARQLGGDEARVALVCCDDDPDGLQQEMWRDVDPEGRIRVFGRNALIDLETQLLQWIQSQSREG
jgi:hypothetical protein